MVANETVVGHAADRRRQAARRRRARSTVHVICPQNQPKHGYVIYDEAVRGAAENRLAMTIAQLKEAGIEATGEVMDPDPYSAIMDALGERDYDEIIISTHPETRSGWLRQDLVTRVEQATRRPVEHVVVDLDADEDDAVAHAGGGQPDRRRRSALIDQLKELAAEGPHRFIVICPSPGTDGEDATDAPGPHAQACSRTRAWRRSGQVTHPDPYTAIQQRAPLLRHRRDRDLHLPGDPLRLAARRPRRPRAARPPPSRCTTSCPTATASCRRPRPDGVRLRRARARATSTSTTGRPRPTSPRGSRRQFLGMLLFIISEIMLFGAFFTAYFFIRVVADDAVAGRGRAPAGGDRRA